MRLNLKTLAIIFFIWNICCLLFLSFYSKTFWYDEAFSIGLIEKSFKGIWDLTALDVHPPLYYFILKIFASIFGYNLITYYLCSLVGILCIYLLAFFPIKRLWGSKTTYAFTLLISILPITIYLGTEIRMYSWLCFFVIATAIYGYESYIRPNYISYFKFTFFAICAPYTHNYGLVSVLIIYAMLFVMHMVNKKKIGLLLISALVGLAIFSFWIPSLYYQVTAVKKSYWIELLTIDEIPSYAISFFDPLAFGTQTKKVAVILFIILYIAIFTYIVKVKKRNIDKKRLHSLLFFLGIFFFVLLSTATVSFFFKPILIQRYLLSVLGCLVLSIAIFVASVDNRSRFIKICGLIIIITLSTLYNFRAILSYFYDRGSNQRQKDLIEYFHKNITPTQTEYSIVGSGFQKFIISVLSLSEPESKYRYFFNEKDIAYNSWTSYPFDVEIIYSLKNEPETVYSIKDFDAVAYAFNLEQYQRSIDDLIRDEQIYYTVVKIDTVDVYEIKTLKRKNIIENE